MARLSKRMKNIRAKLDRQKFYALKEAFELIKATATAGFDESVDISVNLGVDPRKSDQIVRGSVVLPKGTGKSVRIAVMTQGDNIKIAQDAGADIVGLEDIAEQVKAGIIDFDVLIASPDAMRLVGQLGQILGPRGLMPNPKVGTVTTDVGQAVKNAKAGQVQYRTDRAGVIHATIGRVSFSSDDLFENLKAFVEALVKAKPQSSKGQYLRKISLSSTMGIGLKVDIASIGL